MTPDEFNRLLERKRKELENTMRRSLPVIIGRKATDFYKGNFRQRGFRNNGLHPWKKTQRQQNGGKHAAHNYGPLMSARLNLYGSIRYVPGDAVVTVGTEVPYATVHNKGGTVTTHPTVTQKMRKFAWRRFFETGGKKAPMAPEAEKWKALALTKKTKLDITANIPQRQFIGESTELDNIIQGTVEKELTTILNK